MRTKYFIAPVAAVVLLLVAAVGVLAYDHSKADQIADGISVGGVDVGGLSRDEAHAKLQRAFVAGLRRTIVVDHGRDQWHLTAKEARISADLDATVDDAIARSRRGNFLSRAFREATGGEVHAALQPQVTYSEPAVIRLLTRVKKTVDRAPVDAKIAFSAAGVQTTPSRDGLAVDTALLRRKIQAAIVSPTADRRFSAKTEHTVPKMTTEKLAQQNRTLLIVNRGAFRLQLYKDLKLVKSYPIAVGAVGLETPAGLYHIQNKAVNPAWTKPNSSWVPADQRGEVVPGGTPQNPLKARWLGIFDGAGIHGIDPSEYGSIGHAASHGCVRMRIPDVIELYDQVPVGAPIYIA